MLVYLVSFYPTKWLRNFARAPISVSLVYLVPLARSRYCASPEASIMRLKAAAKMGATASAPTQHFLPHKMAAQFCGGPELRHVFVIAPLLRRQSKTAKAQPEHSTDAQRRQLSTTHYELRTTNYELNKKNHLTHSPSFQYLQTMKKAQRDF